MTTPAHTAIWQKTLTFPAERLDGDLFMPACAMPPAAGSGDRVEMTVGGVHLQINLTLPPIHTLPHTTVGVIQQDRPQVS